MELSNFFRILVLLVREWFPPVFSLFKFIIMCTLFQTQEVVFAHEIVELFDSYPELLQYIPDNEHFDITDLLEKLRLKNKKIGVYPITEHDWVDIGQWTEYHNAINKIDELKIAKN